MCLALALILSLRAGGCGPVPEEGRGSGYWVNQLKDTDPSARKAAAEALKRMGSAAHNAVPGLLDTLKDGNSDVVVSARSALNAIGTGHASLLPLLRRYLKDENADVRLFAAGGLGRIGAEASPAVPELVVALGDSDEHVRVAAAVALGAIGPGAGAGVPTLVKAATESDSKLFRSVASNALLSIRQERAVGIKSLVELSKEANYVGDMAVLSLVEIGSEAVPALIAATQAEDPMLRASAIAILGQMGSHARSAMPAVKAALRDGQDYVRQAARDALQRIAPPGDSKR